jgi:hypothetical protein
MTHGRQQPVVVPVNPAYHRLLSPAERYRPVAGREMTAPDRTAGLPLQSFSTAEYGHDEKERRPEQNADQAIPVEKRQRFVPELAMAKPGDTLENFLDGDSENQRAQKRSGIIGNVLHGRSLSFPDLCDMMDK